MPRLPFCAVAGSVPEKKLVELLLKSSKDLYSILCSLQFLTADWHFYFKELRVTRYYFGLVLFYIIPFFSFLYFLCWNSSLSGPPCLQRERGRINLEILAFAFQIPNREGRRKFVSPRKVTLISMAGKGFPEIRNIPQGPGLFIEGETMPHALHPGSAPERQGDLWISWVLRAKGWKPGFLQPNHGDQGFTGSQPGS